MARLARFIMPGQAQHVIQRGNNKEIINGTSAPSMRM
jgi:hypothetical protein